MMVPMTNEEAKAILENEKKCVNRASKNNHCNRDCYNCELVKTDTEILTALDKAMKALELMSHLKNRPCSACEYHKENGCCKWSCVFEK